MSPAPGRDRPEMRFAVSGEAAKPLHVVPADAVAVVLDGLPEAQGAWANAQGFAGKLGELCLLPAPDGTVAGALVGFGSAHARARGRFPIAKAVAALPGGNWALAGDIPDDDKAEAALGWLLAGYRFAAYKDASPPKARLVCPEGLDAARIEAIA